MKRQGNPPVIGLLGGVGAGKTTVAGMLRELGASVHDADRAVHEALKEPEVKTEAVALLGREILGPDGEVDRALAAKRVFGHPGKLKALEGILHPRVRRRMEAWMEAERGAPALVLDVPLLAEAGLDARCDLLLYVDAPADIREARSRSARAWAPGEAARREARQGALEAKRRLAQAVIVNAGDLAETRRQVSEFWNRHVRNPQGGEAR